MSRLGKTLGLVFAVLVLVLAAVVTFTIGWRPFIGPRARALTARKFGSTPARLARGEYLVRDVTNCMACHAEHDWTAHDAPILPNTLGAGQDMNFLKGLPGKVYAPNMTPDPETGVGNWSDDQLARAIREGVTTMGGRCFRSCRTRISDPCPTKTWPRSSCTCGRCRRCASSSRRPT